MMETGNGGDFITIPSHQAEKEERTMTAKEMFEALDYIYENHDTTIACHGSKPYKIIVFHKDDKTVNCTGFLNKYDFGAIQKQLEELEKI